MLRASDRAAGALADVACDGGIGDRGVDGDGVHDDGVRHAA